MRGLLRRALKRPPRVLASVDAYRLWSQTYDRQPDNVVLHLEAEIFSSLLDRVDVADRRVLDVGCGTGRHWEEIAKARPAILEGVDSSPEMLERLLARFPGAKTQVLDGVRLEGIGDATFDVLVSTLAIGHIAQLERAIGEWSRVLPRAGALLLTDFHPAALRRGMKRTFSDGGRTYEAESHVHDLETLVVVARAQGMDTEILVERAIDERVRHLFEKQDYREAFDRHRGTPLVYGLLARKRG
jgi:ubiquinone/menaquinone biosynthesis C-methylase UbiE